MHFRQVFRGNGRDLLLENDVRFVLGTSGTLRMCVAPGRANQTTPECNGGLAQASLDWLPFSICHLAILRRLEILRMRDLESLRF